MYNSSLRKNEKLIILYIASSIILEIIFFVLMGFGVFPKYFWFDLCGILMVVSLIYLAHSYIIQSILFWFFYSLQVLICLFNLIIKKCAGDIFTIDMIFLSKEGIKAFEESFIDYKGVSIILLLFAIILYFFAKISRIDDNKSVYKTNKLAGFILIFFLISIAGSGGFILQGKLISDNGKDSPFYVFESDKYLFENLTNKIDAYKKFGTFGFYIKNITNFTSEDKITEEEKWTTAKYLSQDVWSPSEYFGVSKRNNVITILLETMEYYAIDPYFTPNLYNIFFESDYTLKLNNFYANNRTNISEGLVLFGSYDKQYPINLASDNILGVFDKDVNFTLPDILSENGYTTRYYHDYCSWYYNRNVTHPAAGFDYVVGLEGMDRLSAWVSFEENNNNPFYEWKNWTLDSEVMDTYFDEMTNRSKGADESKRFYTHFSLITMHGNHQQRNQLQGYFDILTRDKGKIGGHYDKMCEFIENMNYIVPTDEEMLEHFLWYKAAAMDVDKMIGIMFDKMKSTYTGNYDVFGRKLTLFDETTVLFFADHNCYYNGLAYEMRGLEYSNNTYDVNLYKIPCALFDTKLCSKYFEYNNDLMIDKFTSTYNLLPTILDVLGIRYNSRFYYGDNIFSDVENVFQSNINGCPYFTDKFLLTNNVIEWSKVNGANEEENLFKENALKTYDRIQQINKIYRYPEILDMYSTLIC